MAAHCNFRALFMFEWQGWSSLAATGKYQFVVAYWNPELNECMYKFPVNLQCKTHVSLHMVSDLVGVPNMMVSGCFLESRTQRLCIMISFGESQI